MSLPPLPESLAVFTPTQEQHGKLNWIVREYGALCRKQALEEAAKVCEDIDDRCHDCLGQNEHEFCTVPTKEDYIETIRGLLTLPRVEQGSVPEQIKPHSSGEVVRTVTWDVVQAKDQPS